MFTKNQQNLLSWKLSLVGELTLKSHSKKKKKKYECLHTEKSYILANQISAVE